MKSIGLDIGTTTICGVVTDGISGKVLATLTLKNDSALIARDDFSKLQDALRIKEICQKIVRDFSEQYKDVVSIGVTGQMHGIVYLDKEGIPVTPLFSWQDGRANLLYKKGKTYCEYISEKTGYPAASGYGLMTHFYNKENGLVPKEAVVLCTIPDYITMFLAGNKRPMMHKSMAASIGLFDVKKGCWDENALEILGISKDILPDICSDRTNLTTDKTMPDVSPALGDNQASFVGSVGDDSNVLVNIGTGSQISIRTSEYHMGELVECRPFLENEYLIVGAPLCGGASYALLKNFFQSTLSMFGYKAPENIYEIMNRAAEDAEENLENLMVDTRFNGTRKNPKCRGSIQYIGINNFMPGCFAMALLRGMGQELYDIYAEVMENIETQNIITGSGNGIRQNPVLQKELRRLFNKE